MKFTPKQRVMYLWKLIIWGRQQLDIHNGDQDWYTNANAKASKATAAYGRRYIKDFFAPEMALDILAMINEEVSPFLKPAVSRKERRSA